MNRYITYKSVAGVFWSIVLVLHVLSLLQWHLPIQVALSDGAISTFLLFIASWCCVYPLKYYQLNQRNVWQTLVFISVITVVWNIATCKLLVTLPWNNTDYTNLLTQTKFARGTIAFLIICFSVTLRWVESIMTDQRHLQERQTKLLELAKNTELKTLREQLHPHFLFNTLNSVSALIGSQPESARNMILQLSDFLRGSLSKRDKTMVQLSEELKQIQLYLDIEKVRFGHRLQILITVDDDAKKLLVPSFVAQPLVENAVKYGLYDTTDEVAIEIKAKKLNNLLQIEVINPFDETTSAGIPGTGFGQKSIKRRLYLLFGRTDLFEAIQSSSEYRAVIKIPQA